MSPTPTSVLPPRQNSRSTSTRWHRKDTFSNRIRHLGTRNFGHCHLRCIDAYDEDHVSRQNSYRWIQNSPGAIALTLTGTFFNENSVERSLVRCDEAALLLLYANFKKFYIRSSKRALSVRGILTWSWANFIIPLILVMFITTDEKLAWSSLPLERSPRNAVVTKNTENVLILYRSPHDSKLSLLNKASPKVPGSLCSGEDILLKKVDTGPTWPELLLIRPCKGTHQITF